MMNQFRADLIGMDDTERVPCGMKTIIWLADSSIRLSVIMIELEKEQNRDKVVICSKWNEDRRNYVVYASYTLASINTHAG